MLSCQCIVATELVKDKSIDWVLHQFGAESAIPSEFGLQKNIIRVDLVKALPVPSPDTPIDEILQFKESRRDELRELHNEMDRLYELILTAPDQEFASKKEVFDFSERIKDLDKVANERFGRTRKFDLSVELNISGRDISLGASSGVIFDIYASGLTFPIGTVVGALASMIRITSKATNTFQPAENNSKLGYLSAAQREGIVPKQGY